jgi:hypothetical protein
VRDLDRGISLRLEQLLFLAESVLKDHRVNNLPAEDAPPPEKVIARTVKPFKNHDPAAPTTFHGNPLQKGNAPTIPPACPTTNRTSVVEYLYFFSKRGAM